MRMGKVLFLSRSQFNKRFPNAKRAKTPNTVPRVTFRNPVQFQIRFPKWKVCQGFSKAHGLFAWVEYRGMCLDLSAISEKVYFSIVVGCASFTACSAFIQANSVPRDRFYRECGISGVRRYAKDESREMINKYGNYGMWRE